MFLGAVMFSITLPSMVFFYDIVNGSVYAENRDEDGDIIALDSIGFYSLIVASFSVGQAVASPPFGWWFNRSGARQPYVAGLIFLTAGSLIYAMATNQVGSPRPSARRCVGGADDLWPCPERAPRRGGHGAAANRTQWMLVIARFLGGLGAGTPRGTATRSPPIQTGAPDALPCPSCASLDPPPALQNAREGRRRGPGGATSSAAPRT